MNSTKKSSVMKFFVLVFLELLATFPTSRAIDCSYEQTTSHVEYICDREVAERFGRRNVTYLYCNNYPSEITRENVRILTFSGCKYSQLLVSSGLYQFKDLRILNVSTVGIESLYSKTFGSNGHLESFIASHNNIKKIPSTFFMYTPELREIDLSHNKIEQLPSEMFSNALKLKTLQIAHNQIRMLPSQLFVNLVELEVLDVSHNSLDSIDNNSFISNKNLRSLNLNNNPLARLPCEFLTTLNSHLLRISFTSLVELETNCANENKQIKFNVTISSTESTSSALTITDSQFQWSFTKTDFMKLRKLNFSNSDMKHIPSLLEEASTELITLDLSNTFVGQLSEKTFQKFTNLQFLYLSRTNLSNFKFQTFYHQTKLKFLDLSYNELNSIDFRLFLRNFQSLESLNLEGNNLTEIDSVTRTHFPKLSTLAISKNRFACEYLVKFLLQWHDLKLFHNPSPNQMHIGGVDCIHGKNSTENIKIDSETVARNSHLSELYAIKILLIILISIISIVCVYIFFTYDKCKRVRKLYQIRKNTEIATESILYSNQQHNTRYNEVDNHVYNELSIKVN